METGNSAALVREKAAGAMPGKSLVVHDSALEMTIDVFPCEDGHAQERALLEQVLLTVHERDVWIMDRNFCVRHFLLGIAERGGYFIGREHQRLACEALSAPRYVGQTETGKVYE